MQKTKTTNTNELCIIALRARGGGSSSKVKNELIGGRE